ncbi:uncharacterized protein RCO7_05988 [Rhynchosporium graminicola]|uniref:Uncharacterized protein n=1 Tax=Rhynchosporium graminicola TaxID=2792576 RepID=A0A1E1KXC3_9HELO|nr:uncharacterized protein RCO7_05988 [Rhynchosporium commune]
MALFGNCELSKRSKSIGNKMKRCLSKASNPIPSAKTVNPEPNASSERSLTPEDLQEPRGRPEPGAYIDEQRLVNSWNTGEASTHASGKGFESLHSGSPDTYEGKVWREPGSIGDYVQDQNVVMHLDRDHSPKDIGSDSDITTSDHSNSSLVSKVRRRGKNCNFSERLAHEISGAQQTEDENLRNQVIRLQNELSESQAFVLSHIPQHKSLTETEATADFTYLCGAVEEWVDCTLGDAMEDGLAKKEMFSIDDAKSFLALIPKAGRDAFSYPHTDTFNVTAAILMFLQREVFTPELYGAITPVVDFLSGIEMSMMNMVPTRGVREYRTWHSETYTAIANHADFESHKKARVDMISGQLSSLLRILCPQIEERTRKNMIKTSIVEPAVSLAHKMSLSADIYTLEWTSLHNLTFLQRQNVQLYSHEGSDSLDLLSQGRPVKDIREGEELQYLFDYCPRLTVRVPKGDKFAGSKLLKRSKIIVALIKPSCKKLSPERDPRFYIPEVTFLQWLDFIARSYSASDNHDGSDMDMGGAKKS